MDGAILSLEDIVKKTTDLPTFPAATLQVIQLTENSDRKASDVANALAQDQALSARVLRLANSAFFGLQRQVSELSEAVVVLGMRNVRNLALIASSYPWLARPLPGYGLGPEALWNHSFACAVGAQMVAKRRSQSLADTAFTAGLLCDIGKLALSAWFENKTAALYALAIRQGLTFDEAESQVFGFDHSEVGGYLAEQWNLPASLVHAIRYHHSPMWANESHALVDMVHIGDFLAMQLGHGLGGDGLRYRFFDQVLARNEIEIGDWDKILEDFIETHDQFAGAFGELAAA